MYSLKEIHIYGIQFDCVKSKPALARESNLVRKLERRMVAIKAKSVIGMPSNRKKLLLRLELTPS